MVRKARVDANQKDVVSALRKIGASVGHTHMVGKGFPDIVVGFRGMNFLFEIKDGGKPPSKQALTEDEVEFHNTWNGSVEIVYSPEHAVEILMSKFGN